MKKRSSRNKKSREKNPFTMLGSYIGLIIGLIFGYFSFRTMIILCEFGPCKTTAVLLVIIPIVLGFIFGWAIQSFFTGDRE